MMNLDALSHPDPRRDHMIRAGISRALAHRATDPVVVALYADLAECLQNLADRSSETIEPARAFG